MLLQGLVEHSSKTKNEEETINQLNDNNSVTSYLVTEKLAYVKHMDITNLSPVGGGMKSCDFKIIMKSQFVVACRPLLYKRELRDRVG